MSYPLFHSPSASYNSQSWVRTKLGAGNSIQVPLWISGIHILEPSFLPLREHSSRKLELEGKGELEPCHSDMGYRHSE